MKHKPQRTVAHIATREFLCAERTIVISQPPTRHAKHVQTQSATLTATSQSATLTATS